MSIAERITITNPGEPVEPITEEEFDERMKHIWAGEPATPFNFGLTIDKAATNAARALGLEWEPDFFDDTNGAALDALTNIFESTDTGSNVKLMLWGPESYRQFEQIITWWIVNKKWTYRRGKSGKLIRRPSKWYEHCCELEAHRKAKSMALDLDNIAVLKDVFGRTQ